MTTHDDLTHFIEAVNFVIPTMTTVKLTAGAIETKKSDLTFGCVSGLIGLAGKNATGTLMLSFEESTILHIFKCMLMEELKEINDEVADAVGEVTNMVCGDLKRRLAQNGVEIGMATPIVICGQGIKVRERVNRKSTIVEFQSEAGKLCLETNFARI